MIRPATTSDLQGVIDCLSSFHAESGFQNVPVNWEHVAGFLDHLISADYADILCHFHGNKIDGICLCAIAPFWFNPNELRAFEFLLYMMPESRGTFAGAALCKAYKEWGKNKGVRSAMMEITAGITPPDKTNQFFAAMGGEYTGGNYVWHY